jgi:hypothetical protein
MAHFAKLDENNIVLEVIVIDNSVLLDKNGVEREALGVAFLIDWSNGHGNWKQTSYNAAFRKNYAGIGYTYDQPRDAFIAPKPYTSWVLDEETCLWQSPTPRPDDGKAYYWDEQQLNWIEVTE